MAPHATIARFVTGDYLHQGKRVVAVAYLVRHPDATLLFDTGFPFDDVFSVSEGGAELRTFPRSLEQALGRLGTSLAELDLVANCHLHIDHAGGNFRLPANLPIYAQRSELGTAAVETEELVTNALALDRKAYRAIDGETEILPGIRAIPTPGHTNGHQSLAVATGDGEVVLLGQGMPSASEFASSAYALQLEAEGSNPVPPFPAWLPSLLAREPARVCFAHDLAIWQPESS